MSKKSPEKKSADQIGMSFKKNEEEQKLYEWLKRKLNPGIYLKEIAYREYLIETGKLQYVPTQPSSDNVPATEEPAQPEPAKTTLIKNEYGFADDEDEDE